MSKAIKIRIIASIIICTCCFGYAFYLQSKYVDETKGGLKDNTVNSNEYTDEQVADMSSINLDPSKIPSDAVRVLVKSDQLFIEGRNYNLDSAVKFLLAKTNLPHVSVQRNNKSKKGLAIEFITALSKKSKVNFSLTALQD